MPMESVTSTMSTDGMLTLNARLALMPSFVRWTLPIPSVIPLRWAMPTCAMVAKSGLPSTTLPTIAVTSG